MARRDAVHDAVVDDDVLAEEIALVQHGLERHVLAAGHLAEARARHAPALSVEVARCMPEVRAHHAVERARPRHEARIAVALDHNALARRLAVRIDHHEQRTAVPGGLGCGILEGALPVNLVRVGLARPRKVAREG